jgi:hypothetical protein
MNLNYKGSLAEERMKFRSTTEVVVNNKNELFNYLMVFVPSRFAGANIVDWDESLMSAEQPAIFVCDVNNYAKTMKGALLDQWQPAFRQDSNSDILFYLVVFKDDEASGWEIDEVSIKYGPLSTAFNALYHLAWWKFMFDPDYDGSPVII